MTVMFAAFPWGPTLSAVGVVIGVAGVVGAAIAVARTQMARTTIELYKADNEALRKRIETLEDEKVVMQGELAEQKGKVATLESSNRTLADQVTGASAVAKLAEQVREQHREVVDLLRLLGVELKKRAGDLVDGT